MRPLSAAQLLDAWERGLSEPVCRRVLPLLAAAAPDVSGESAALLTIGERDRWLLTLREWTFGSQLESVANCSACSERLEWTIDTRELRPENPADLPAEYSLEIDGYHVNFRFPNTLDLAAVTNCAEADTAYSLLLKRCIAAVKLDGQEIPASDLPGAVTSAVARQINGADPQTDVEFDLTCPACGHRWQALFDIEFFFWAEINAWAQRTLADVHTLASAYGWREADILNLSAWRRQFYLDLASG